LGSDDIHISPDIVLVFVSIDPDKRLKLYKLLSEKASVKSFPALSEGQLVTFLQQKL
jgi:DNA polymerase III delta subunit